MSERNEFTWQGLRLTYVEGVDENMLVIDRLDDIDALPDSAPAREWKRLTLTYFQATQLQRLLGVVLKLEGSGE